MTIKISIELVRRWLFIALALLLSASASFGQTNDSHSSPQNHMGFTGTWEEFWPGIPQHAIHTIQFTDNKYVITHRVPGRHVVGGEDLVHPVKDVTIDGDLLRFKEITTIVIEYELRVKDDNTLQVRAKGISGWEEFYWKRVKNE